MPSCLDGSLICRYYSPPIRSHPSTSSSIGIAVSTPIRAIGGCGESQWICLANDNAYDSPPCRCVSTALSWPATATSCVSIWQWCMRGVPALRGFGLRTVAWATKRARLRKEGWRWTRSSVGFIVAALVAVAWLLTAPPPEPPPPPPAWIHWKTVAPIEEKAFIGDDLRVRY